MASSREMGTCLAIFPLKLGVGLITAYEFATSLICIVALFSGDITFQANGYNLHLYYAPSIVGSLGLIFSFVGLLGTYNDQPGWVRSFNLFMQLKLATMMVTVVADFRTLQGCEAWLTEPGAQDINPQLYVLAEAGVCPWAQWSYILGCSIDISFNMYLTYQCLCFYRQLLSNPSYPIDFGIERLDATSRWKLFGVKNPHAENVPLHCREARKKVPQTTEMLTDHDGAGYGATEKAKEIMAPRPQQFVFGPDGMPMPPGMGQPVVYGPNGTILV